MNKIVVSDNINIENMIYEIRGKKVMLDSDVAFLFDYQTKELNRNIKNNIERFPENYCFRLTEQEYEFLRCNFSPQVITIVMVEEDIYHMYLQNMVLLCLLVF